jgi:uncharacterized LabA/DUF88 family protein
VVLIDGENFVHKLCNNLVGQNLIKSRNGLKNISIQKLLTKIKYDDVYYYTTKIVMPKKNHKLHNKVEAMRKWNDRFVPSLANQNVKFIKAGFLRVRDDKKCMKCGYKNSIMAEKGVDVRLALDIVKYGESGSEVFVLSSDTDLLPSIIMARDGGARITYVAFEGNVMKLLSKYSSRTIILTSKDAKAGFVEANRRNNV